MTQAVAETLPTVDMVKKAMLSTSGDGDALCARYVEIVEVSGRFQASSALA